MDKETVIRGLEHCSEDGCKDCPYEIDCIMADGFSELAKDVLELLKEQEPIQMKVSEDYGSIKFGCCPKCKSFINNRNYPKSCGCGQKVKWDD